MLAKSKKKERFMLFIIQQFLFPKQYQRLITCPLHQCNYVNNYYGDQECLVANTAENEDKDVTRA
tara:strand:+ start:1127 stop:1321 length:195 start_codon:yes stop_codon:yes gene_type:complete